MATNEVTTLRKAIVALLLADTTLRTITGRTEGFVITWNSIADADRPVITYLMSPSVRTGGSGHRRRIQVLLGAYAQGNGAYDKAEAMTRRAREILTAPNFATQGGLHAEVMEAVERAGDESDGLPGTDTSVAQDVRHDLDLIVELSAPT